jgi:hypothetical protein
MPIAKRTMSLGTSEPGAGVRSRRRTVTRAGALVEEPHGPIVEEQDLGVLMARTLDHRHRASQALARLRSLQQTVLTAAAAGKSDIERKMEAALVEYRIARFSALRARRRLLAGLTSNETC